MCFTFLWDISKINKKKIFLLLLSGNSVHEQGQLQGPAENEHATIASLDENPISSSIKDQASAILW